MVLSSVVSAFEPSPSLRLASISLFAMFLLSLYEWATGKFAGGRKTPVDWQMFGLSTLGIMVFERPVVLACVAFVVEQMSLDRGGMPLLRWATAHPIWAVLVYLAVDELIHGWAHNFAHKPPPKHPVLAKVHAFYREAHRGHHLVGGPDGHGQVSATHAVVAGWGWLLLLPNYWFGALMLALGFVDAWLWANLFKSLWGLHVHTNWGYDLALLNHRNAWVRKAMHALCHVLTFPNQHHHHHARGRNSARNMQNVLALYDWLLWGTLVIERQRPSVYGWKQRTREQGALYRYLNRPLKTSQR